MTSNEEEKGTHKMSDEWLQELRTEVAARLLPDAKLAWWSMLFMHLVEIEKNLKTLGDEPAGHQDDVDCEQVVKAIAVELDRRVQAKIRQAEQ